MTQRYMWFSNFWYNASTDHTNFYLCIKLRREYKTTSAVGSQSAKRQTKPNQASQTHHSFHVARTYCFQKIWPKTVLQKYEIWPKTVQKTKFSDPKSWLFFRKSTLDSSTNKFFDKWEPRTKTIPNGVTIDSPHREQCRLQNCWYSARNYDSSCGLFGKDRSTDKGISRQHRWIQTRPTWEKFQSWAQNQTHGVHHLCEPLLLCTCSSLPLKRFLPFGML